MKIAVLAIGAALAATITSVAQMNAVSSPGQVSLAATAALSRIPKFSSPVGYDSGGTGPNAAVITDVNGDGKPDVVVVSGCISLCVAPGAVGVLLNQGGGVFGSAVSYATGGFYSDSVAVGDFNGDGKVDIVVGNSCTDSNCSGGASLGVLLGNGNGTFQPAVVYDAGGSRYSVSVLAIAVGDFNGDGRADLAVTTCGSGSIYCTGQLGVLLGNGDGTFKGVSTFPTGGEVPLALALADMNGDGRPDAVIGNQFSPGHNAAGAVGILLGKADGTFQPASTYAPGGYLLSALAVGDLNGDGKLDIVVGEECCAKAGMSVLLGKGDGTVQPATSRPAPYSATVVIADMNGDSVPDVVLGNGTCTGCNVSIALGKGDGTFGPLNNYGTPGSPSYKAVVGDANGDGKLDVLSLAANGAVPHNLELLLNALQLKTNTMLASSLNPSHVHQAVTFTATVNNLYGGKTSGKVRFKQGTAVLGAAAVVAGKAKFMHTFASAGSYSITAAFLGDTNSLTSSSSAKKQVVQP